MQLFVSENMLYINRSQRARPRNESWDFPSGCPRPVFMTNRQKLSFINVPGMEVELNVLSGAAVHLAGFGGEETGKS
jgi:hypothetical protein